MINLKDKEGVQEIDNLEHRSSGARGTSIDQISVFNVSKSDERRNYIINDNYISIIYSDNENSRRDIINKEVKGLQERERLGHLSCLANAPSLYKKSGDNLAKLKQKARYE